MSDYQCEICGEQATRYFGYTPLCASPVCRQALIDDINAQLQEEVNVDGKVDEGDIGQ